MASATPSPNFFYRDQAPKERKESFSSNVSNKLMENPLLSREQPKLVMETPTHGNAFASSFGSVNDTGEKDGLRRRHRNLVRFDEGGGSGITANKENHSIRASSPSARPPPRASYSLGTEGAVAGSRMTMASPLSGSSGANRPPLFASTPQSTSRELTLTLPSTTNCWVMVYGYTTEDQYEKIKQRFASYGRVLQYKGMCHPGYSNWVAIQYANELEAKKATYENTVQIDSNIFVGVKLLDDNDPIVLHKQPRSNADLWTGRDDTYDEPDMGPRESKAKSSIVANGGLTEKDILLQKTPSCVAGNNDNICVRILRFLLAIPPKEELIDMD